MGCSSSTADAPKRKDCDASQTCSRGRAACAKNVEGASCANRTFDIAAIITYPDLPVNETQQCSSPQLTILKAGTEVRLLEFAEIRDEGKVRARIEWGLASPSGWITMWFEDGANYDGFFCVKPLQDLPGAEEEMDSMADEIGKCEFGMEHDYKKPPLVVRGVGGILTTLNTNGISTVFELKELLQIVTGIPTSEQRLFWDNAILLPYDPVPKKEVLLFRASSSRSQSNVDINRTAKRRSHRTWDTDSPPKKKTQLFL